MRPFLLDHNAIHIQMIAHPDGDPAKQILCFNAYLHMHFSYAHTLLLVSLRTMSILGDYVHIRIAAYILALTSFSMQFSRYRCSVGCGFLQAHFRPAARGNYTDPAPAVQGVFANFPNYFYDVWGWRHDFVTLWLRVAFLNGQLTNACCTGRFRQFENIFKMAEPSGATGVSK